MIYGLIGEKLGHSYSKSIHEQLADYTFLLLPMPRDEMQRFLEKKEFGGIMVTIPYKQEVIPFCEELDSGAKAIGAVNTVVNRGGKLYGYNTDYRGFLYLLKKNDISLCGKTVMILGTGGTCKTVTAAAQAEGAKEIITVSRTKKAGTILYGEAVNRQDVQVIINTSPVGMYPNSGESPLPLDAFVDCEAVVDVIYNPLSTQLVLEGRRKGIKSVGGLRMLVAQAKYAAELFCEKEIPDEKIEEVYHTIRKETENLVLIGMPGCGKSTVGKLVAEMVHKTFVDVDAVIVEKAGMPITELFSRYGEEYFRTMEREVIQELAAKTGQVIATGGGAVKDERNILALRQNGRIVFLNRSLENLRHTADRPLASTPQAMQQLYEERYSLYTTACDWQTENNGEPVQAVEKIKEWFCEDTGD